MEQELSMSTIAEEITALNTNLAAAKAAVTTAGGTVGDTGLAGLATEIGTIPSGGGGKIGDFNIISGKVTPSATTTYLQVMTYSDFLAEVGGTMPSYVFAGIFNPEAATITQGVAHGFAVIGKNSTVHYKNGSTTMTRSGLQVVAAIASTASAFSPEGVYFSGYTGGTDNGKFQAGVEYTWFVLWKN